MNSSASGPVPLCAQGHSATYDPDSKSVFVYGGLRKGLRYTELYILNTLTWKWKLVTVGCCKYYVLLNLLSNSLVEMQECYFYYFCGFTPI